MMFTKHRILTAVALFMTAFGISAFADQLNNFTSNISKATNGLFTSETDEFLDVNNWQNVEFDKFFSVMQVDKTNGLGAGLALKAGAAYLGFGYFGKFWTRSVTATTTEYGDTYAAPDWRGKQTVSNGFNSLYGPLAWTNRISFLLGTDAIGGILLDFNLAGMGKNDNGADSLDAAGGKTTVKNIAGPKAMAAGLGWGRNFDLEGGYTFKPNLGFNYTVDMQKTVYDSDSGETITLNGIDPFFRQDGYTGIQDGRVGLTGIITAHARLGIYRSTDARNGSVWADYNFETHTYDRQTANSSGYWEDYGPAYAGHIINAGIGAWYTLDHRISYGWSVEGGFGIANARISSVMDNTGLAPDHEFKDVLFKISPKIAAGIVYRAVPDRFNLNGGLALYPAVYSHRKFTHVNNALISTTTTGTTNTIGNSYTETSLGFTWFIIDGLSFDTAVGIVIGEKVDLSTISALFRYKR